MLASENERELSVEDIVVRNTGDYGKAVIRDKFPSPIDGLRRVHTRLLWMMRNVSRHIKGTAVVAETMKLHPHGDVAIYESALRLAQEFHCRPPLMEFKGDIGMYSDNGESAAAMRYSDAKISDFAYDIFYSGVDASAIPKMPAEDLVAWEPINLIPSIPTALLYASNTIGFGFSGNNYPLNLENLCDITVAFITHMKTSPFEPFDLAPYAEKMLPDFPIFNTLTNVEELVQAYKLGNFDIPIMMDGAASCTQDSISIYTLPYGNKFSEIKAMFQDKEFVVKKKKWEEIGIYSVNDPDTEAHIGHVLIKLKRNANVFEAWNIIRKLISFSNSFHPVLHYRGATGTLRKLGPVQILREWYHQRFNILMTSKKHQLMRLTKSIRETEALLIIVDKMDQAIKIIRENEEADGVAELMKTFDLTEAQAIFLNNQPLKTLNKTSKNALKLRMEELNKSKNELLESFNNIPNEMISVVQTIKKRYGVPRTTRIPKFIGYIAIHGGYIQFEHIKEIPDILNRFRNVPFSIFMYDGAHRFRFENGKVQPDIPEFSTGKIYSFKILPENVYTYHISKELGGVVVKGFLPEKDGYTFNYTTKKSKVVWRDGRIKSSDITQELSPRKSICSGAATDVCYAYPDTENASYLAVFSDMVMNVLTIYKVLPETSKLPFNPTGKLVLYHSQKGKDWFINVDQDCIQRLSADVIHIPDVEVLLEGKSSVRVELSQQKWRTSKILKVL